MTCRHTLALSCLTAILLMWVQADTAPAADPDVQRSPQAARAQTVLREFCYRCHGAKVQKADLRLDQLATDFRQSATAETWHDVLNKLNLGEMPPEDASQPTAAQMQVVTDWLTTELKAAALAKRATGRRVVLRRLTRYEYNNTLRDLLGIDFDFAQDLPPEPMSQAGFRNNGSALGISPLQIELYLESARRALDKVIVTGPAPEVVRHHTEKSDAKKGKKSPTSSRVDNNTTFVARLLEYPREGEVVVRVKAHAEVPEGAGYPRMRLTCGMRSDVLTAEEDFGATDVTATADEPGVYEFRGRIEQFPLPGHNPKYPGVMFTIWNDYQRKPAGGAKPPRKKKGQQPEADPTLPVIVVQSVDFEGPVFDSWPPATHTQILFAKESGDDEVTFVRKVIRRFATRAFRRPLTAEELQTFVAFFNKIRADYPTMEDAVRETLAMVLVSPQFLYLVEPTMRTAKRQPLSDYELASRISYFLWSSTPNQELMDLAEQRKLRDPNTLAAQVSKMLDHHKSSQFVEHFTDQWLNLSGLDRVAVNPEYFPDFDDRLKADMRGETQHFFAEILHQDLSALNLIQSDFTMLNRRLAQHYGISGPRGSTFERVSLTADQHRGGLLTHGSILLANSTGEQSHPIRRAVWLLDRLLDSPPAPPPPDVPELNPDEPNLAGLPLKRQLEIHRTKEACNQCHRRIDPWGVAFEHYDAIGQWREEVQTITKKKKTPAKPAPVVAQATLPGGHHIDGLEALKDHLLMHEKKRFARALVAKLLSYALGRSLELSDEPDIESLAKQFEDSDFRMSHLILAIVQSEPFQHK